MRAWRCLLAMLQGLWRPHHAPEPARHWEDWVRARCVRARVCVCVCVRGALCGDNSCCSSCAAWKVRVVTALTGCLMDTHPLVRSTGRDVLGLFGVDTDGMLREHVQEVRPLLCCMVWAHHWCRCRHATVPR